MTNEPPTKLGKYEIISEIAQGSMGTVYLGHDSFINREVAIKVAHADSIQDKSKADIYRKMFFNEAHTAGMLNHPNILAVYDAGVDNDNYYIVMEYVSGGQTLKSFCRPGDLLPINKVVEIVFKCAKALDYAHGKGVIHRDIKPSNILVSEDQDIKLADFSIAFIAQPNMENTQPLGLVGSPMYMSPEQVQEEFLTHQTDLFSLGIILYELLTGNHPFRADNFSRLVYRIAHEEPMALRKLRPEIPESLENIVRRALSKDTSKRYKNGMDLASDLSHTFSFLDRPKEEVSTQEKFDTVKELAFFRQFPESEIWEVLRVGIWNQYHPEEEILTEGDIDDAFYIIIRGDVHVMKGSKQVGQLRQGDCFGEMGYITKTKRTASIYSRADVILLKINATLIEQTSLGCQLHFHKVFLKTLIERLSRTTEQLSRASEN